ncbi:MAG: ABC transporter permease [Candidatus ainarchaeum sp.]|nr:ABC transporter permease [Candidatus ainarchaeum sp.]
MNKTIIIAKHEFKSNAKRKGYLLFALVLPILFIMLTAIQASFGTDLPREVIIKRAMETPIPLPIILPSIFGAIFSVAIFISSGFLLYGMVEEKENRLIEILLTSVSTKQLLFGKILGLGLLGIVQLIAWLVSSLVAIAIMPEILWMANIEEITIPMVILVIIFFLLAYSLFAIIIAGIGAMLADTRQASQISGIITIVSLIPSWAAIFFFSNPLSEIPIALSYIPITGPITMAMRVLITSVPAHEIIISIAITAITIAIATTIVEKKLKQNLLVYDKRITGIE